MTEQKSQAEIRAEIERLKEIIHQSEVELAKMHGILIGLRSTVREIELFEQAPEANTDDHSTE